MSCYSTILLNTIDILSNSIDILSNTIDILLNTIDILSNTIDILLNTIDILFNTIDILLNTIDIREYLTYQQKRGKRRTPPTPGPAQGRSGGATWSLASSQVPSHTHTAQSGLDIVELRAHHESINSSDENKATKQMTLQK